MLFKDYISGRYPKTFAARGGREITLRPLQPGDQQALLDFFGAVPESDRLFLADDVTDPRLIEGWCKHLDFDLVFPLLALAGDRIVGNSSLHRSKSGWMTHVGRVRIVVHPDYRGVGVAKALVGELIEIGIDIGLDKLDAEFMSGQEKQMAAFEKLGFARIAELSEHVHDRRNEVHDLIVMTYELKGEAYAVD